MLLDYITFALLGVVALSLLYAALTIVIGLIRRRQARQKRERLRRENPASRWLRYKDDKHG